MIAAMFDAMTAAMFVQIESLHLLKTQYRNYKAQNSQGDRRTRTLQCL